MKTAAEAMSFVDSLNARRVPKVPKWARDVAAVRVYSLYWHPFRVGLGHMGEVVIPALDRNNPEQMKRGYSEPLVLPGVYPEMYDLQSGNIGLRMWSTLPDAEDQEQPGVLLDVLGTARPAPEAMTPDRTWFGVFAALGTRATKEETARFERKGYWEPTAHEVRQATDKLSRMMLQLYQDAEAKANEGPQGLKQIQPMEREAAEYLNLSPEWARKPTGKAQCPECGHAINPGQPVCFIQQGGCGAVLDEAKVIRLRTPGYEHIWSRPQVTGQRS